MRLPCLATAMLLVAATFCFPAQAGGMHQSPGMKKNATRMCPNGKPMHMTGSGRSALYGC